MRKRLADFWVNRGVFVLAFIFVGVFFGLMVAKHDAFNTRVYDFARFGHAVWNTLHGRFLFTTIKYRSILGDHFSPIMAFASPLFLIWSNERMLFLVQVINLAVAGLFLYKIVRVKRPLLAPWFLLAFYLNPALHEVALFEFRRVVFAVPFLAMALYALFVHNRRLMLLGLVLALLAKENIGFFVFMIGFYILVVERDWKWGVSVMGLGAGWLVVVSLWVIPAFNTESADVYPQLYYFDFLGSSYEEVIRNILSDPLILLRRIFSPERLLALGRVLLPLGVVLPFLAPAWVMICLPYTVIMLMSGDPDMYQLQKWYMATLLPVLFAAVGVGLSRFSVQRGRWLVAGLLATTVLGYFLFSPAPLGGQHEAALYEVTAHDRLALEMITAVPPDARVAAQVPYVPHLIQREDIYHYPWIKIGEENIDYFMLDRHADAYPFDAGGIEEQINKLVTDPAYVVEMEADGLYLLRTGGQPLPSLAIGRSVEAAIKLERVEIAVADGAGFFQTTTQDPIELRPGQQVRVSLYWEALAAPEAERTVSVRLARPDGFLLAQQDSIPGGGSKPTSWWQPGWRIRDVYYLAIPAGTAAGPATLDVVLYDTYSLERVAFDNNREVLTLQEVVLTNE